MDFKLIDGELLLQERPNLKDDDSNFNDYIVIYSTYLHLLMQYLTKEFYLSDADNELMKNQDMFAPLKEEDMDFYQNSCSSFLKYFYLRNDLYIERLNKDDIEYLYNVYKSDDKSLTDERKDFIERTYPNIIFDNPNESNVNVNYGPDNIKFFAPSNGLVIGVRYAQFDNLNDNDVINDFAKKEFLLSALMSLLEKRITKNKKIPVKVIKYDDYSVRKPKKL